MNRRIVSGVALASAAAIAFTGCSSSETKFSATRAPATPTPGPTMSPLTLWAGRMCVAAQGASLSTPPSVSLSDVNGYLKAVPVWLADSATKMNQAAAALKQLPPAPGGVASDHLAAAITSVTTYAAALTQAQDVIGKVKPGDSAGLQAAMAQLTVVFKQVGQTTPVQELSKNAEMKKAIDTAPTCSQVRPPTPAPAPTS